MDDPSLDGPDEYDAMNATKIKPLRQYVVRIIKLGVYRDQIVPSEYPQSVHGAETFARTFLDDADLMCLQIYKVRIEPLMEIYV